MFQSLKEEARTACTRAKIIAGQRKNPEVAEEAQECLDLINKLGT